MALATQQDVEDRLGRQLSEAEAARLPSLLNDASSVVVGYAGQDFEPAPYPTAVVGVVAKMAARLLAIDPALAFAEQQTNGPFSIRYSASAASGDVYLTAADKLALRAWRRAGGISSVQFVGERYSITPDQV